MNQYWFKLMRNVRQKKKSIILDLKTSMDEKLKEDKMKKGRNVFQINPAFMNKKNLNYNVFSK